MAAFPLAAQGNSPVLYETPISFASFSVNPAQATSGSVYTTLGIADASNTASCPAATSAATFPS